MKVAMVTPMSPASAIADVMMQAVPYLAKHWDVTVWCPTQPSYRSSPVELRPFEQVDGSVIEGLRSVDLAIYVLGDSPWHVKIQPLVRMVPGLVVLHDLSLANLVRTAAIASGTLDELARLVRSSHGADLAELFRSGTQGDQSAWLEVCAAVPLTSRAIEGSLGAVVHSEWHRQAIEGTTLGEVTTAPLPVPSMGSGTTSAGTEIDALLEALTNDSVLVVTVGTVNANRRIDLLLESLESLDGSGDVHLWAVGPANGSTRDELRDRSEALGVAGRFALPGRLDDDDLQKVLARADIGVAIREPVLEGQSASLLTQMLAGLPVIVFDHAHYSEMPDEVVVKVDPEDASAGLRGAFQALIADPEARRRRGEAARQYVTRERTGEAYASELRAAAEHALGVKPRSELVERLASGLRRRGLHSEFAPIDRALDLVDELFGDL